MKFLLTALLACQLPLTAATVWKIGAPGITEVTFTKAPFTSATDPANWDDISPSVAITRVGINNAGPLHNPLVENFWTAPAPAGTTWAFASLNGNPSILSADNFASLTFAPFRTAFGGTNPSRLINRSGVLHLVAEDIYLDITFNSWGRGMDGDGGSFSYTRAQGAIPEPSSSLLLLSCGIAILLRRRR